MARLNVELNNEDYKRLHIEAIKQGLTISDLIRKMIEKVINDKND